MVKDQLTRYFGLEVDKFSLNIGYEEDGIIVMITSSTMNGSRFSHHFFRPATGGYHQPGCWGLFLNSKSITLCYLKPKNCYQIYDLNLCFKGIVKLDNPSGPPIDKAVIVNHQGLQGG